MEQSFWQSCLIPPLFHAHSHTLCFSLCFQPKSAMKKDGKERIKGYLFTFLSLIAPLFLRFRATLCLFSLYLFLSFFMCVCLLVCLSLCRYVYSSVRLFLRGLSVLGVRGCTLGSSVILREKKWPIFHNSLLVNGWFHLVFANFCKPFVL